MKCSDPGKYRNELPYELSFLSLLIYSYTESYPTFVNEASQKFYLEFKKDKEHEVKSSVLCKFEYSHPTSLLSHIPILDLCMGKHKSNHNLTRKKSTKNYNIF